MDTATANNIDVVDMRDRDETMVDAKIDVTSKPPPNKKLWNNLMAATFPSLPTTTMNRLSKTSISIAQALAKSVSIHPDPFGSDPLNESAQDLMPKPRQEP